MTSRRVTTTIVWLVAATLVAVAAISWAQDAADQLTIDQPVDHDVYAARQTVNVSAPVNGDVVAAGRQVTVDGPVTGDVIVAAQTIEIRSSVSDDLRAAGQHVLIASPISGHVVAAGQTVTLNETVDDWAWLAGYTVEVRGKVGSLRVRAKEITIEAEIAGDVEVIGDQLNLGSNAVIHGDVRWYSDNAATVSAEATVRGELIHEPMPGMLEKLSGGGYSLPLNTIVAVMVLFLLFSPSMRVSANRIEARPGRSVLLGLVMFLGMPLAAVLLFYSGIGVWLGFAVLFVYFVILLIGGLTGLFAVSDMVLRRFSRHPALWQSLLAIFLAVVMVNLLTKIPWLGVALVFAILLTGVGALCWNAWAALRGFNLRPLRHASQ